MDQDAAMADREDTSWKGAALPEAVEETVDLLEGLETLGCRGDGKSRPAAPDEDDKDDEKEGES
jgi:hypothetical protein